jgi:hypothetical protein
MNMKITAIIDYISYLVKKYGEIQQVQMKNTFRVASIKRTPAGTKIIFQVIGKSTFMECMPAEILSNDAFIERFSHKDVQKITYAHAQEESLKQNQGPSPDLKLIQQEFNMQAGRTQFVLRDKDGNTSSKTAEEIVKDKKIVKNLTQQDAMNIGYIAGYEHSQNDTNN